jgi:hypothetical protein
MQILFYILLIVASLIVAILIFGSLITFLVEHSRYQAMFVQGRLPEPAPDGFHPGLPHVLMDKKTPWLGKSFDSQTQTGFNVFTPTGAAILKIATPFYSRFNRNSEGNTSAYHFKTCAGKGRKDRNTDVIKLDYDSKENPWLIRIILDEIVEITPRNYLGKIHVKFLPGFYVTIGYFGLQR